MLSFVVGVFDDYVLHLFEHLRENLASVIGAFHYALLKLTLKLLHLLVCRVGGHLIADRVLTGEGTPL